MSDRFRDGFTSGLVAGLAGGTVQIVLAFVLFSIGISKVTEIHIAANALATRPMIGTPLGFALAIIAHLTNAAFWGVLLSFLISSTGRDYYALKGAAFGAFAWLILYGLIFRISDMYPLRTGRTLLPDPASALSVLATSIVFGLVSAYTVVALTCIPRRTGTGV